MTCMKPRFFRKKPVIVEAFQLTQELALAVFEKERNLPFGLGLTGSWHTGSKVVHKAQVLIHTLEGNLRAELNDWVIKGIRGELYPCQPVIFDATYESVDNIT